MTLIFVFTGSSGSRLLLELHLGAVALGPPVVAVDAVAHEQHGKALGKRGRGAGRAGGRRSAVAPDGSDSSHGKAIVTPTPRSNVASPEIRWLAAGCNRFVVAIRMDRRSLLSPASSRPRLFRNCGLVTMLSTSVSKR